MALNRLTKKLGCEITGSIVGQLYVERFMDLMHRASALAVRVYNEELTTQAMRDYMAAAPDDGVRYFDMAHYVSVGVNGWRGTLHFSAYQEAYTIQRRAYERARLIQKQISRSDGEAFGAALNVMIPRLKVEDKRDGLPLPDELLRGYSYPSITVQGEALAADIQSLLDEREALITEMADQSAKLYALIMSYRTVKKLLEEMPEASKFVTEEQLAPPQKTQSTAIADVAALKAVVSQAASMIEEAA